MLGFDHTFKLLIEIKTFCSRNMDGTKSKLLNVENEFEQNQVLKPNHFFFQYTSIFITLLFLIFLLSMKVKY